MREHIRIGCICFAVIFALWVDASLVRKLLVTSEFAGDWTVLWPAARSANPYANIEALPFAYPPTALLALKPFALLPFFPALVAWSLCGAVALYFAGRRLTSRAWMAFLLPAAFTALQSGQMSLFVGALMIFGLTDKRPALAGLCFAFAGALKPQMLVALPITLAVSREWRLAAYVAAFSALLALATVALWGVGPWIDWLRAMPEFRAVLAERGFDRFGVGLNALALRWNLPALYWLGIPLGVACATLARPDPLSRLVALTCSAALISPYMLHYDLAGFGVAAVALLSDRDRPVIAWVGAGLAVSFVLAPVGIVLLALWNALERVRQGSAEKPSASGGHALSRLSAEASGRLV